MPTTIPTRSGIAAASSSTDSTITRRPTTRLNTPIGTLMKNAHRQLARSMITAPIVGANDDMVPDTTDHTAIAVARR